VAVVQHFTNATHTKENAMTAPSTVAPSGTPAPVVTAPAPQANTPAPAPAAAYDWKASGFDDADLPLITDRQWKGPKDVFVSYKNLEKLTGVPPEQMVKLPKDNDPAAWNEVYTKLGRPATADKYNIPLPEGDKGEFAKTAREWFHEAGMSQSAVTKVAEKWNAHLASVAKSQADAAAATLTKETTELKAEWADQFDKNCSLVDKAATVFGMGADTLKALKTAMGPKAAMKFLHTLGTRIAVEDTQFVDGGNRTPDSAFAGMTPQAAMSKIESLKNDKAFVQQWNSRDPKQRMEARAQLAALNKIAYPGMTEIKGTEGT
jgi:hypothetical protein